MAILGNFDDNKTGQNLLERWSGYASYIPGMSLVVGALGFVGTGIESIGWILRGKFGSALTTAATGTTRTVVNMAGGPLLSWGSMLLTGHTAGHVTGDLEEKLIGTVAKPQVLSSYPAGIGSINAGVTQDGPGRFTTQVANERGANANELYNNYMRGEGGVHVNELNSAYGRSA